ncbi:MULTISPECIES: ABC transporter permease [unclassified Rathayibacter]|uniref:ABC transporter permease n=1 Tax=unclassified Rathayibacter TaxID=2609250 RepID=UPI0006F41045|nr:MULTISPECIES: ABC transporter permease [unclassified Rathayibacter]KQQ05427.1 hypothetical protein ASF42_02240 [Rathayibacter sp. Leaf294]KQS13291.1 hypothetical protein ASG06_02250 [Rathayibacter sp. Leaf185]
MTTLTPAAQAPARRADLERVRLRTGGIVASEALKLITVRSTWWSIGVSVVLALALALTLGASFTADTAMMLGGPALVASGATVHLQFVGLVIAVLGALTIGGEYSTGMIRSTYTAVPRRLPSLLARGAVVAVAAFLVGVVTCVGSFLIIAPMLAAKGAEASLIADGVLQSLLGGAFYLAVIGAFAVGVAALLRSTAAAIGISVGVLFVLPIVASIAGALLQAEWIDEASRFLLSNLGLTLTSLPGEGLISGPEAVLASLAWVAVVWIPALIVTRLRDV